MSQSTRPGLTEQPTQNQVPEPAPTAENISSVQQNEPTSPTSPSSLTIPISESESEQSRYAILQKTWTDTDTDELKRLGEEIISKRDEEDYRRINKSFEALLEKLKSAPENNPKIDAILSNLTKTIHEKKIEILTIIKNPLSLRLNPFDFNMDGSSDIATTESQKKEKFLKKGLSASMIILEDETTTKLGLRDNFLFSISTKVTFILHWSATGTTQLNKQGSSYRFTKPLLENLCPQLADQKQSPRLKRLTLLGCCTGSDKSDNEKIKPETIGLYLATMSNYTKIDKSNRPFYCMIYDKKTSELVLYFITLGGELRKVNEGSIHVDKKFQENVSKFSNKFKPFLSEYNDHTNVNLELIHKAIYNDTYIQQQKKYGMYLNGQENLFVRNMLWENEYFKGNKSSEKKAAEKFPLLGHQPVLFKKGKTKISLGEAAYRILNAKREHSAVVEVKAYTVPVVAVGQRIIPQDYFEHHKEKLAAHHSKSIIITQDIIPSDVKAPSAASSIMPTPSSSVTSSSPTTSPTLTVPATASTPEVPATAPTPEVPAASTTSAVPATAPTSEIPAASAISIPLITADQFLKILQTMQSEYLKKQPVGLILFKRTYKQQLENYITTIQKAKDLKTEDAERKAIQHVLKQLNSELKTWATKTKEFTIAIDKKKSSVSPQQKTEKNLLNEQGNPDYKAITESLNKDSSHHHFIRMLFYLLYQFAKTNDGIIAAYETHSDINAQFQQGKLLDLFNQYPALQEQMRLLSVPLRSHNARSQS